MGFRELFGGCRDRCDYEGEGHVWVVLGGGFAEREKGGFGEWSKLGLTPFYY